MRAVGARAANRARKAVMTSVVGLGTEPRLTAVGTGVMQPSSRLFVPGSLPWLRSSDTGRAGCWMRLFRLG